ncbi:hypothetical protein PVAP13_2KG355900 [Panicum virgatum]|uniref:Uncharacterized protein n=1 Tax=Panicum virgatum TaxID=38727 RepID=A0A8T0WLB0_PANVG|nr:hypothetical protein PVAP13_2KG355900 [Panicum virgatum]
MGLHKVKHLFQWGAIHKVGNSSKTSFWKDIWIGDVPLKISFPDLFAMSEKPEARVAEMCRTGEWSILLRRSLSPSEECNFYQLMQQLQSAWPSAEENKRWRLLFKPADREEVEEVLKKLKNWASKSRPKRDRAT